MTGKEALERLIAGNKRYVAGTPEHPNQSPERRKEVGSGQTPFACILGCADSRVPPEIIFDQGLGDLFVLRVAGNVANEMILGSLEYAVEHLGAQLIVVLGHKRCGAVAAAVSGGEAPGHIGKLVQAIQPAVDRSKSMQGDAVENAVRENIQLTAQKLQSDSSILKARVDADTLDIIGAFYDLDTGQAGFFPN